MILIFTDYEFDESNKPSLTISRKNTYKTVPMEIKEYYLPFKTAHKKPRVYSVDEGTLKTAWEGVIRSIAANEFATAFCWWYKHCEKFVRIVCGHVEKT